jgi:hypothetical protein
MLAEKETQLEASKEKVVDKEGQLAKARDLFGKVQQDHKQLQSGLHRLIQELFFLCVAEHVSHMHMSLNRH